MARLAAVAGYPVHHSLSPAICNAAFSQLGLDWKMLSMEIPEGQLDEALSLMREIDMGGMSITMPHKKAAAEKVDILDESASALDAVNCIVPIDGKLVGHNTDGKGFIWSLNQEGVSLEGARVLIFGAGGASRAVGRACILAGAKQVGISARSKSQKMADMLGSPAVSIEDPMFSKVLSDFEVLINATPLGMEHLKNESPVEEKSLEEFHTVIDLVYRPARTELLNSAQRRGATAIGGLGMLIGQAVEAVKLWTGMEPDSKKMHQAVAEQSNL